ncbi:MAG: 4Fe-4S binding protein [Candidatus Kuenenia sp.]|nr:4Fe-4S binding protein [Candidatus Kuenenia hertensis]
METQKTFTYRIRFHGRGGQGAKVASRILGTAAFLGGLYAQDFPLYGAERRGAPILACTRISSEPILERGVINNPDIIIIMDETLLDDTAANPLSDLKKGGIVFINSTHTPEEIKTKYHLTEQTITLDITKISLELLGKPILSTLAGGVASKITNVGENFLRQAVEMEVSEIIQDKEIIEKNIKAALHCFLSTPSVKIDMMEIVYRNNPVISVPFEPATISSPTVNSVANTPLRKTGNWRVFKPVWNYDACTKCMICVNRCPDSCISINEEGFPFTDYNNCKGCMICMEECPSKAIEKKREVHAW